MSMIDIMHNGKVSRKGENNMSTTRPFQVIQALLCELEDWSSPYRSLTNFSGSVPSQLPH
jgi:hypothetical protein